MTFHSNFGRYRFARLEAGRRRLLASRNNRTSLLGGSLELPLPWRQASRRTILGFDEGNAIRFLRHQVSTAARAAWKFNCHLFTQYGRAARLSGLS